MKNLKDKTIAEKLHALADGQLNAKDRKDVLQALENSPELRGEMCDIYRIKDLVQTAYPLGDFEHKMPSRQLFSIQSFGKVASYLLAFIVTLAAGYTIHDFTASGAPGDEAHGISIVEIKPQNNKVILFLGSSEPAKFMKTLSKAESLAKKFEKSDGKVYVVTSAAGIDLLRSKTSPHKGHIIEMAKLYPSLHFVACNNTLYQYKKAGKPIELIESAEVAPSAVEFVVKHLQQGWRYIAI
jgi:intracellular sulfur oxidation DsrE/DsrF family protein